jgi:hypothetical protein
MVTTAAFLFEIVASLLAIAQKQDLCGLMVSSWLQIQRSGFDSRRYQIFWEVVGLERRPLSLVSTIEELLDRKCRGLCLENLEYGHRDHSQWPLDILYPQEVGTNFTDEPRSFGRIIRSRTEATEFIFFFFSSIAQKHLLGRVTLRRYLGILRNTKPKN